ncbi:hypothetical protein AVEN_186287-1 [Araneus ventricosus]|uniref:Uncharacterized protein n=1 Tax=Araneus ventricosus TaxID=182803 RepID=A0A4Y2TD81_ARAVE|nr:hypothetical protein AVEN_271161-1 [Araneus ventricosus]GBN97435.1 hypothetical protein AVEN_181940-1 [Araneus ventricosus]GBN98487.1 hypothetical protein AVEN_73608-1 [Araneus ventricosus]GBN98493.1 hypothetical protein AVEN_186287-1 [Araneus ventricosus]
MSKTRFPRRRSTLGFDLARGIYHTIPPQLLCLFALIFTTCALLNPSSLWGKSKDRFSEDIFHEKQGENPDIVLHYVPQIYKETFILLEGSCLSVCGKIFLQFGLPVPTRQEHHTLNRDLLRETNYDISILQHMEEKKSTSIFDRIFLDKWKISERLMKQ